MDTKMLELMHDQVRAIYRALVGKDLPEPSDDEAPKGEVPPVEGVARLFAELDAAVRANPRVAERVAPFYFTPPLDATDSDRELLVEVGVPGVEKKDVRVELNGDLLTISGYRGGERIANGKTYLHAELPRGPFRRVLRLPYQINAEPRFEVEQGLIRVRLAKPSKRAAARA